MNIDQADAIENLMAQGFTRVQAIKIFYERSLAKYYTKQYHTEGADVFDQTGLVRSNVEKFHALEQSHLTEKPINATGRRFSMPVMDQPDYEQANQNNQQHPPRGYQSHQPLGESDRTPSEISLDSCFKNNNNDATNNNAVEVSQQPPVVSVESHQQPPLPSNLQIPLQEKQPGMKETMELFPTIEFENEVNYDDDSSLCGQDPTISNVAKFLSSCDFTTAEKQEFFYLLSQGCNIDEASDQIYQNRLAAFMNQLSPTSKGKMTKSMFVKTVHHQPGSVRPRYPLRLHGFAGQREDDVKMLLDRRYPMEVAFYMCDFMYDVGADFFKKLQQHYEEEEKKKNKEKSLGSTIPEEVVEPASTGVAIAGNNQHNNNNPQQEGDGDDEIVIENGEEIAADTIIQLKRLKTFARGGFKSNFSVENNCAVSELEALKLGLIISQQEADYGINMYDALMPSDEQQIEKLIRAGLTLDEAILKVFESRFGKTKLDSSALQMLEDMTGSSSSNRRGDLDILRQTDSSGETSRATTVAATTSGGVDYEAADKLESEISLLMLSGYTRETAVKILLDRKKKDSNSQQTQQQQQQPPQPQQRTLRREMSQERIEREILNQLPPSSQRNKTSNNNPSNNNNNQTRASPVTVPKTRSVASEDRTEYQHQGGGVSLRSGSDTEAIFAAMNLNANSGQTPPRFNSEYEAMIHHQLSIDPYQQPPAVNSSNSRHSSNSYNLPYLDTRRAPSNQYDVSSGSGTTGNNTPAAATAVNNNNNNAAVFTPPNYQRSSSAPAHYSSSPAPNPPHSSSRNEEFRILRDIPAEEKAYRIGILISQQEAAFGTNMYQSIHTNDAAEMTHLIARGYNEDEAALALFERKYGRTPPPSMVEQQQVPPVPVPQYQASPVRQESPGVVRVAGINSSPPTDSRGGGARNSYQQHSSSPTTRLSSQPYPPPPHYSQQQQYYPPPSSHHHNLYQPHYQQANSSPVIATAVAAPVSGERSHRRSGGGGSSTQSPQYARSPLPPGGTSAASSSGQGMRRVPSMHQHTSPPPIGMMNPNDISDIRPQDLQVLMGMGFSQFQAIQALRMKNYHVQSAAEYLLER